MTKKGDMESKPKASGIGSGKVLKKMTAPIGKASATVTEQFKKLSTNAPPTAADAALAKSTKLAETLAADGPIGSLDSGRKTKIVPKEIPIQKRSRGESSMHTTDEPPGLMRSHSLPSMQNVALIEAPETLSETDPTSKDTKHLQEEKVLKKYKAVYWPTRKSIARIVIPIDGNMLIKDSSLCFVGTLKGEKFVWTWQEIEAKKAATLNGTVQNGICISHADSNGDKTSSFFTFVKRDSAYKHIDRMIRESQGEIEEPPDEAGLPKVPPDSTLKQMNVIINKKLVGVTVQQFYDICWSEGNQTDKAPFYGPWLESSGKDEVQVGGWEFARDGESFVGDWCGEEYTQQRVVTFKFTRTTHLYTGPPVADVKHTQRCRVEGEDKCVMAMTMEMKGIPFGDCFAVEVRWVASRVGSNDLAVEVGLFVNFKKSTMVASKIRAGTTEETTKTQVDLFERAKEACGALVCEEIVEEQVEEVGNNMEAGQREKFAFAFAYSHLTAITSAIFGALAVWCIFVPGTLWGVGRSELSHAQVAFGNVFCVLIINVVLAKLTVVFAPTKEMVVKRKLFRLFGVLDLLMAVTVGRFERDILEAGVSPSWLSAAIVSEGLFFLHDAFLPLPSPQAEN